MDDTNASEAGRALIRHRWGNRVPEQAAEIVIERSAELYPDTRAAVVAKLEADMQEADDE
jgi:hypothetical protein